MSTTLPDWSVARRYPKIFTGLSYAVDFDNQGSIGIAPWYLLFYSLSQVRPDAVYNFLDAIIFYKVLFAIYGFIAPMAMIRQETKQGAEKLGLKLERGIGAFDVASLGCATFNFFYIITAKNFIEQLSANFTSLIPGFVFAGFALCASLPFVLPARSSVLGLCTMLKSDPILAQESLFLGRRKLCNFKNDRQMAQESIYNKLLRMGIVNESPPGVKNIDGQARCAAIQRKLPDCKFHLKKIFFILVAMTRSAACWGLLHFLLEYLPFLKSTLHDNTSTFAGMYSFGLLLGLISGVDQQYTHKLRLIHEFNDFFYVGLFSFINLETWISAPYVFAYNQFLSQPGSTYQPNMVLAALAILKAVLFAAKYVWVDNRNNEKMIARSICNLPHRVEFGTRVNYVKARYYAGITPSVNVEGPITPAQRRNRASTTIGASSPSHGPLFLRVSTPPPATLQIHVTTPVKGADDPAPVLSM